jgi:hypothetical protein
MAEPSLVCTCNSGLPLMWSSSVDIGICCRPLLPAVAQGKPRQIDQQPQGERMTQIVQGANSKAGVARSAPKFRAMSSTT